jgi:hypothetical protein
LAHGGADGGVVGKDAFAAPVVLRVGIDDDERAPIGFHLRAADLPEFACAFGRGAIGGVGGGEVGFDLLGDACAHGVLAVAAVDDDIKFACEGEGD